MWGKNKRKRQTIIVCAAFSLFWIDFSLLKSNLVWELYNKPVIRGFILSVPIASILVIYYLINHIGILSDDLKKSNRYIREIIEENDSLKEPEESAIPVVNSINQSIAELSKIRISELAELNKKTAQLNEKNIELNDAYMQLESSFGQLQAVLEQLNDSEKKYHSLVVNIPDIVLTLDSSGVITYASRACKDILSFRRRDIVGKPFNYIIHDSFADSFNFDELITRIKNSGEQRIDISLRRVDNTVIQTEIKFTAIVDSPNNDCVQAIIRDVTEQKRMEDTLRQNNRRLEILNGFSHKLASATELTDIYKTCVNTVTNELGFYGCIYFIVDKNERFYKIKEYTGEYFNEPGRIEQFTYINRNAKALSYNDYDGIVLDYEQVPKYLVMNDKIEVAGCYRQAYIQQLRIGGHASGLFIVLNKSVFIEEELNVLRSIGHTTLVAVENTMHLIESKNNFVQTIDALVAAIEAKDQYTRGHSQRVSSIAVKIADRIGMAKQQIEELRIAGILHDIGKIGISDRILLKKGPLTKEEYEIIKKHPAISNRILYPIGLSERILKAVAFHHERFDGKGYPFGLTNESLGLEPQIIAVADAYDAMTSSRPYRGALSYEKAVAELKNNKGSQFHPGIVNVMLQLLEEKEVI
jgi:PAS domain S-box-containing protein/putative nucleotidyltransferase with HDIG domain